ncbi:hypothetical protein MKX03_010213 [Papaver bracteatum]|nr:hypothetical protein MKX03_010200 [Papaver bracteatum]KAI3887691.1 hypothetical protein MKX03_010213 [Papaver bracteatum]
MAASNPKFPKFILLMIFYILSTIGIFIFFILEILGFVKFADSDDIIFSHTYPQIESHHAVVATEKLIRRTLPVVKFEDLILTSKVNVRDQDCCAICLCEYEGQDEIRPLLNCRHIFHGSCLDRWMINNQRSCPLCRTSSVPVQMSGDFKEINLNESLLEL